MNNYASTKLKSDRQVNIPSDKINNVLINHFKSYPNAQYFRASKNYNSSQLFINPKKIQRASKDANNAYYVLMDNLPSWQGFPSRSKSIIFTNYRSIASEYQGKIYQVYPSNNSKVAYARYKSDFIYMPKLKQDTITQFSEKVAIYASFMMLLKRAGGINKVLDSIEKNNKPISDYVDIDNLKAISRYMPKSDPSKFWESMLDIDKSLNDVTHDNLVKLTEKMINHIRISWPRSFFDRSDILEIKDHGSFIKFLDDKMNPTDNNIGWAYGKDIYDVTNNIADNLELWCDGLCYLTI
jgi:hypothetical protein